MEAKLEETEWVQARYDQLNLIEKKRLKALCHGQLYQKWMIRALNKKVRPQKFREGDLILKKILPNQQDQREKWASNWDGPYVVKRAFLQRALILTEIDGNDLPSSIISDAMKKYYA